MACTSSARCAFSPERNRARTVAYGTTPELETFAQPTADEPGAIPVHRGDESIAIRCSPLLQQAAPERGGPADGEELPAELAERAQALRATDTRRRLGRSLLRWLETPDEAPTGHFLRLATFFLYRLHDFSFCFLRNRVTISPE